MFQNQYSMLLFNKSYYQLKIAEINKLNQYIYDMAYPKWEPVIIDGIKTDYEISNTGRLLNKRLNKICSYTLNSKGYQSITLIYIKDNKKIHLNTFIHRLVATAFIPNPENKPQVNHINGNKEINWVGNLEWNTCKENIVHAVNNGLTYKGLGENANGSIYSDKEIHEVCKLLETGKFLNTEISEITGVNISVISKVKCKECWTHISNQYNIKKPVKNAKGSLSASSKYSENQIHKVCKLLELGNKTMTEISKETNVGYDMIYRIKTGKNWLEISSKYKIPSITNIIGDISNNKLE